MAETTQPVDSQSRDRSTEQEVGGESSASMKLRVSGSAWLGLGWRGGKGALLVWGAEFAGGGVAVVVCPAGDGGHGDVFAEDAGDVGLGFGGQVVVCYGGDGGMADDAPGVDDGG